MIEGKENSNQSQSTAGVCVEQAKAIRQMPTHSSPSSCLLNKQLSLLVSLPTLPQKCYSNLFKWKQNNKSSNTVMHQLPLLGETPLFHPVPRKYLPFQMFSHFQGRLLDLLYLSLNEGSWSLLCPSLVWPKAEQTSAPPLLTDIYLICFQRTEMMLVARNSRESNLLFSIHIIYKCNYSWIMSNPNLPSCFSSLQFPFLA